MLLTVPSERLASIVECIGVLRLRCLPASQANNFAQDDKIVVVLNNREVEIENFYVR
jgi:hypothetical protein